MKAPSPYPLPYPYPIAPPYTVEELTVDTDGRCWAPAAERNKPQILEIFKRFVLLESRAKEEPLNVLEVGCGTGQHSAFFQNQLQRDLPQLSYRSTDLTDIFFSSVEAHQTLQGLASPQAPALLDLRNPPEKWGVGTSLEPWLKPGSLDAIICINVTHVTSWEVTCGLILGAASFLHPSTGLLFIYGSFTSDAEFISDGSRLFDERLRATDPEWGSKDISDIQALANDHGLVCLDVVSMPADDFTLVFRREGQESARATDP